MDFEDMKKNWENFKEKEQKKMKKDLIVEVVGIVGLYAVAFFVGYKCDRLQHCVLKLFNR